MYRLQLSSSCLRKAIALAEELSPRTELLDRWVEELRHAAATAKELDHKIGGCGRSAADRELQTKLIKELRALTGDENGAQRVAFTPVWVATRAWLRKKLDAIPGLEMHTDAVKAGDRVLLIDDLIATGGTMMAGMRLLERLGATVIEGAAIVDLPELHGSDKLRAAGLKLFTLVSFEGH